MVAVRAAKPSLRARPETKARTTMKNYFARELVGVASADLLESPLDMLLSAAALEPVEVEAEAAWP